MAWANFVDKTANINDPANYVQGSLQADKPDPHQLGDYWLLNHPNWLEVADGWIPPAPVLTIDELILLIEETYNIKFNTLQQRLNNVLLSDGLDKEAKIIIIQNEYKELSDQKDLEILELLGGI